MPTNCVYKYNDTIYTEVEFKKLLNDNLLQFVYSLDSGDIENILDPAFQFMQQDEQSFINTVFKKYPKELQDRVKLLYTVINSNEWGKWASSGITLYRSSARGTGYHEAWHEFSQIFLNKDEKISLYKEAIKTVPELGNLNYRKLSDLRKVEEYLADDFMKYMLDDEKFGKSIIANKPVRNSLYRKILNFLKAFLGGIKNDETIFTNRLNILYSNLRNSDFDNYQFSIDNILFKDGLNRKIEGFDNLEVVLNNKSEVGTMTKVLNHFDALIAELVHEKSITISDLFNNPKYKLFVYSHIRKRLLNDIGDNSKLSKENKELRQFILDNFAEFVKNHDERGTIKISSIDRNDIDTVIKNLNDDESSNLDLEDNIEDNISVARDKAHDRKGNEEDSKDIAAKHIRFLVQSLRKRDLATKEGIAKGETKILQGYQKRLQDLGDNPSEDDLIILNAQLTKDKETNTMRYFNNNLGFRELVDFNTVWNMLQTELESIDEYEEMYSKISELSRSKVYLKDLLRALPNPSKSVFTQDEAFLADRFRTDFMRVKNPIVINSMVIDRNEEGLVKNVRFDLVAANKIGIRAVRGSFIQKWVETKNSPETFVKEVNDENIFDIEKYLKVFLGNDSTEENKQLYKPLEFNYNEASLIDSDYSPEKIELIYQNRVSFLNAFGFMFSKETTSTPEFRDFIMNRAFMPNQIGRYLFDDLNKVIQFNKDEEKYIIDNLHPGATKLEKEKSLSSIEPIKDPLDYFSKPHILKSSDKSKKEVIRLRGNSDKMNELYNFEILHSGLYVNQSSYTATQKIQYENSLYNTFFMYLNGLNNAKKYPTYQDLITEGSPYEYIYNINKNPYLRSSVLFNSLFELDVPPTNPRYGQRRKKLAMKQDYLGKESHVTIDFSNLNGVSINDSLADNYEGENTVKLEPLDRMITSISTMLTQGLSEMMRTADKSTSNAIKATTIFINGKNTGERSTFFMIDSDLTKDNFVNTIHEVNTETNNLHHIFGNYLKSELERIFKILVLDKTGKNEFIDKKGRLSQFILFNKLLSTPTKNAIMEKLQYWVDSKEAEEYAKNDKYFEGLDVILDEIVYNPELIDKERPNLKHLNKDVADDMANYLDDATKKYQTLLESKGYKPEMLSNFISVTHNKKDDVILRSYILNQTVMNIEQTKLIYGDPAFFSAPFKRFAMYMSTGAMPNTSVKHINRMNNDVNYNAYTKALGKTSKPFTDKVVSAILNDIIVDTNSKEEWSKAYEILGIPEDVINNLNSSFSKTNEADAQGITTLDFYRNFKKSIGFWYDSHEDAYNKIVSYVKMKKEIGNTPTKNQIKGLEKLKLSAEEEGLFPPIKLGYGGPMVNDNFYVPAYHKFSVYPILPSMIEKNNNLRKINNKLLNEGIDYLSFDSASKVGNMGKNGEFQSLYSDISNRELNKEKYYPTTTLLRYYKEQLQIEPKDERSMSFGTQFRKLLFSNVYEGGYPIDFESDNPQEEWESMSNDEQMERSEIHKNHQSYLKILQDVANIELEKLLEDIGGTQDENKNITIKNFSKLRDLVIQEAKKKEAPDSVEHFFSQLNGDGSLKYPIETSKDKKIIQDILLSIVNNRLVKLKINGSNLVQVAQTGHERFNEKKVSDSLKGYTIIEKPDGSFEIEPMEIEVSFSSAYNSLLKLLHTDGKPLRTVTRLNEMMDNPEWYADNKKLFLLVGYRIPTQSSNSLAYMKIKQFLPKGTMNLIVVPSSVTMIAGSDFDIDKMSIIRPYLTKSGEILRPDEVKKDRTKLLEEIEELSEEISDLTSSQKRYKGDLNKALDNIENNNATYTDWVTYKYNLDEIGFALEDLNERRDEILEGLSEEVDSDIAEKFAALGIKTEKVATENIDTASLQSELLYIEKEIAKKEEISDTLNEHVEEFNELDEETLQTIDNELQDFDEWFDTLSHLKEKLDVAKNSYSHQKEALFNNLLDIAVNTLKHQNKFIDLVTPNSTSILHNTEGTGLADEIREMLVNSGQEDFAHEDNTTDIFSPAYHAEVYESFMQGKATLGIAALAGPLTQIFQRTGAYVNNHFKFGKDVFKTVVLLNSNKKNIGGEEVHDLSSRHDSDGEILKSELIAQYINAYVDIAKEAFIFYMNAGINVAPTMMYMIHLGIPAKQSAYLINQPSVRAYTKRISTMKSFTSKTNLALTTNEEYIKIHALIDTFNDFVADENRLNVEDYIRRDPYTKKIKVVEYGRLYTEFNTYLSNNLENSTNNLNVLSLKDNIEGNLSIEDSKQVSTTAFLQYVMLELQAASLREVNEVLKSDTTLSKSITEATQHTKKINEYIGEGSKNENILPKEVINKIVKGSEITPYIIQPQLSNMYSGLEKIQTHPIVQNHLDKLLNGGSTKKSSSVQQKIIKDYLSDLSMFIVQNHGVKKNEVKNSKRTLDNILPLMIKDSSKRQKKNNELYAKEIKNIITQLNNLNIKYNSEHPIVNLREASEIIKNLSATNSTRTDLKTVEWIGEVLKKDSINLLTEEWTKFANLRNPALADIKEFFINLAKVVYLTYGENRSAKSFFSIVPSELHTNFMLPFVEDFLRDIDNPKSDMYILFTKYFNTDFKSNNKKYFSERDIIKTNDKSFKQYRRDSSYNRDYILTETERVKKLKQDPTDEDDIEDLQNDNNESIVSAFQNTTYKEPTELEMFDDVIRDIVDNLHPKFKKYYEKKTKTEMLGEFKSIDKKTLSKKENEEISDLINLLQKYNNVVIEQQRKLIPTTPTFNPDYFQSVDDLFGEPKKEVVPLSIMDINPNEFSEEINTNFERMIDNYEEDKDIFAKIGINSKEELEQYPNKEELLTKLCNL